MQYKVQQFLMVDISDEQSVIMNAKSTVIITDVNMKLFLKRLETERMSVLEKQYLQKFFKEDYCEAIEFLLSHKIIDELITKEYEINKVLFISTDRDILESMEFNYRGAHKEMTFHTLQEFEGLVINENELLQNLYIFILNPFSMERLEKITKMIQKRKIMSKVIFPYNHRFYITNLYKYDWYNACPNCFFSTLEVSLRGQDKYYNMASFQTIVDLIYLKEPNFSFEYRFNNIEIITMINAVLEFILNNNKISLNQIQSIDYSTGVIEYDVAYHWELCDCYE